MSRFPSWIPFLFSFTVLYSAAACLCDFAVGLFLMYAFEGLAYESEKQNGRSVIFGMSRVYDRIWMPTAIRRIPLLTAL